MVIIFGTIFSDHKCLAGAVGHRRDLYRFLERLAKEETTASGIAAAVSIRRPWPRRRISVQAALVLGWDIIFECTPAELIHKGIIEYALVACERYQARRPLPLVASQLQNLWIGRALK